VGSAAGTHINLSKNALQFIAADFAVRVLSSR
jgi:hypothetical protein